MPTQTKLATCSYCSARTLLKLTAREGHELACGSCGAPLHEMKWLKAPAAATPKPQPKRKEKTSKSEGNGDWANAYKPRKKRKKRKSLTHRIFVEVWDTVEDIFD